MPGRSEGGNRGPRPPSRGGRGTPGGPRTGQSRPVPRRAGGLNLRRVGGNNYELIHPKCVNEMELDYEEGMELWKAGDPEAARDALRFALQGCGDNIWVHVGLGRIALDEFRDPSLARGHFGYGFELAEKAIPADFRGRLPRDRFPNRPFFEAAEGLATCYDALGKTADAVAVRALLARLEGRSPLPGG